MAKTEEHASDAPTKKPGVEPLSVLTPTFEECDTDWWRASRWFFDSYANDSSPLLSRLSSPPQSSAMVHEQLIDDIGNTTSMPEEDVAGTTTTSSFDNFSSDRSIEWEAETMEKTVLENELQKPLVKARLTSLEERVNELWKARQPHCVKTEMPTLSDHVEDHVAAGKKSSQSDMICVQGYKVKQSVAPILESIFKKHGDIAAECVFKPASMRSSFLEIVCAVVSRIQTNDDIDEIEEIEQQVFATEAANINVSWLRAHLETVRKRKAVNKKCSLLMETKATAILVNKVAQMDLRERCVELVAAQERFEKAERCVRVLHLVEKNLNDNILESKGHMDSLARQLVL